MSYDDFWFIDTRVQTRNLRRYLIWFILLFTFVTVGSYLAIKTMYHDIQTYEIRASNPSVTVSEAKATNVNGYIKGEVKNESETDISNKYLCFLLFNENNKLVGTEYINIGTVSAGQTKTYELKFKRDGVKKFYLILTDDDSELNLEELM